MLVCAMASLCAATWGCKGKQEPSAAMKAAVATPRGAANQMIKLLCEGPKEDFLSCFVGTDDERKAPEGEFDFVQAGLAFQKAVLKAYGQDGWKRFQVKNDKEAHAGLDLPDEKFVLSLVPKANLTEEGSEATLVIFREGDFEQLTLKMVKEENVWKIKAISFVPNGAKPDKFAALMQGIAKTISKYQKAIGKPGIKPEDIDVELGREMMGHSFGLSTTRPHRFNIDEIK